MQPFWGAKKRENRKGSQPLPFIRRLLNSSRHDSPISRVGHSFPRCPTSLTQFSPSPPAEGPPFLFFGLHCHYHPNLHPTWHKGCQIDNRIWFCPQKWSTIPENEVALQSAIDENVLHLRKQHRGDHQRTERGLNCPLPYAMSRFCI